MASSTSKDGGDPLPPILLTSIRVTFSVGAYSTNPKTVSELKIAIQRHIEAIDTPTLESVIEHFALRMRQAIALYNRNNFVTLIAFCNGRFLYCCL